MDVKGNIMEYHGIILIECNREIMEQGRPALIEIIISDSGFNIWYPLVNKHSYSKLPFIVDLPINNDDFP